MENGRKGSTPKRNEKKMIEQSKRNSIFALVYLSLRFVLGEQLREPPEVLRVLQQPADLGEGGRTRRRGQLGDADGGRGRRRRRRWVHVFFLVFFCGAAGAREERQFSLYFSPDFVLQLSAREFRLLVYTSAGTSKQISLFCLRSSLIRWATASSCEREPEPRVL